MEIWVCKVILVMMVVLMFGFEIFLVSLIILLVSLRLSACLRCWPQLAVHEKQNNLMLYDSEMMAEIIGLNEKDSYCIVYFVNH